MAFGWEGELVRLVPLDLDRHLDNAIRWMNDPEITEFLYVGDFPMTRLAERDWFEGRCKMGNETATFAIEMLDGTHVGFSGVEGIHWQHRYGTTGTIIGEKSHWGKSFGTDAARVRARYAFDVLGLELLLSEIMDGNERSAAMQRKVGYLECGRIPGKFWKRGQRRDGILTALTRENWARSSGLR